MSDTTDPDSPMGENRPPEVGNSIVQAAFSAAEVKKDEKLLDDAGLHAA